MRGAEGRRRAAAEAGALVSWELAIDVVTWIAWGVMALCGLILAWAAITEDDA